MGDAVFFGKKEKKEVPPEEIEKMTRTGMSDKDIIKKLKSKGYSYESIERAMLQAVKQGVSEPQFQAPQFPGTAKESDYSLPTSDSFVPESVGAEGFDILGEQPIFDQDQGGTEDFAIEELIEGIVEDKWHKFESSTKDLEGRIEKLRAEMRIVETKIRDAHNEAPKNEVEVRLNEFNDKIDDLDARVGGLEKAFKQFLPALTRNIESLSSIIHEMKSKSVVERAE